MEMVGSVKDGDGVVVRVVVDENARNIIVMLSTKSLPACHGHSWSYVTLGIHY